MSIEHSDHSPTADAGKPYDFYPQIVAPTSPNGGLHSYTQARTDQYTNPAAEISDEDRQPGLYWLYKEEARPTFTANIKDWGGSSPQDEPGAYFSKDLIMHMKKVFGRTTTEPAHNHNAATTQPATPSLEKTQTEAWYETAFPYVARNLDLSSVMVASQARDGRIRDAASFRLVPIVPESLGKMERTLSAAGSMVSIPSDIACTYKDFGSGRPYIDTQSSLGLVYRNRLIAVASAGLDDYDRLKITQLQDVTGIRREEVSKKEYYSTGLHNGLDWRQTLIRAWEALAQELTIETVIVQGHKNNFWPDVRRHGSAAYDGTAEKAGYRADLSGDWVKQLGTAGPTTNCVLAGP